MKRSIVYAGMFSVMAVMPAMTAQAETAGNLSDAVTTSLVPSLTWIEMPEIAPEASAAFVPPSEPQAPTTPSGDGPTTPSGEGVSPEKSPDEVIQESARMRSQTEQSSQSPEKSVDEMDQESQRMRKVGSPRF
ncbi:hypothetical protein [Chlorobaculum limnaeum]|uniref:hypothetical protein n=1 Tax=Chlorobaculum limnaeum TaxID=274537 RepID=UPI0012EE0629|nr:hypothetical protein [Chlorobaculum limnaeum]